MYPEQSVFKVFMEKNILRLAAWAPEFSGIKVFYTT